MMLIYMINNDYVFRCSCYNGHIEIAKWLYSLGGVNIHEIMMMHLDIVVIMVI